MQDTRHEADLEAAQLEIPPILAAAGIGAEHPDRETLLERAYWFAEHAGWSYMPREETPVYGRARSAVELAGAELALERSCSWVTWEPDPDGYLSAGEMHGPGTEFWQALLWRAPDAALGSPELIGSLGSIDVDESDPYAREVAARLALEANICLPMHRDLSRA